MKPLPIWLPALAIASLTGALACRTAAPDHAAPIIQPGAPGQSSRVITSEAAASLPRPSHTAADVRFMQGMISHHAQALELTELLKSRTSSDDMRKLAQRIEVSQADEISMMRDWLDSRGAEVPDEHADHAKGATLMPGMLTADEISRLAGTQGAAFDELFLEYMIKHHEGALVMVKELFASPGAGQESEIFAFASDVDADQRMEIARMAAMLKELKR